MKKCLGASIALLSLAAVITAPLAITKPVAAEEAVVEVTIVEPAESNEPEEPQFAVPNTGSVQIFGQELSRQDFKMLFGSATIIIVSGIVAMLSYKLSKRGGKNE